MDRYYHTMWEYKYLFLSSPSKAERIAGASAISLMLSNRFVTAS